MLLALAASLAGRLSAADLPLNQGWRFQRLTSVQADSRPAEARPDFPDGGWERAVLPHTVRIEAPAVANRPFQGLCWYRLRLPLKPEWRGQRVGLRFDGAMQRAEAFVNGELRTVHEGGYLPFFLDLSPEAAKGGEVLVALRLDNRDMPEVPPGKPMKDLDFCYFGGLYRNAWLVITDPLRITDAVEADRPGSGGIFVRHEEAGRKGAKVFLQAHVVNGRSTEATLQIRQRLLDPQGRIVARWTGTPVKLAPGGETTSQTTLKVSRPQLWHPDHPRLYDLHTELLAGNKLLEQRSTKVGLRRIEWSPSKGFLLNGEPLRLRGANRHNDYPWLGNAIPDQAQERDARRLKAAGFNFLRLAHYPQSPAFLDACDRLGLLVAPCVPGWQWFRETPAFAAAVERDLRQLIRRDRNHPAVLFWETSLNETYKPQDAFYQRLVQIAHEEQPGDGCFTGGDTLGRKDAAAIGYDVPYTVWTDFYDRPMAKGLEGRAGLHREYGDYEFGGENSTSRMARGDGETAQLLQAWNYLWSHNRNLGYGWTLGDAIWVGIDHFRGCSEDQPISRCGALDYLRLPKYAYQFYRSQRNPDRVRHDVESGPMAFLATEWTPRSGRGSVVVFSNGDEVELFLNGRSLGRRRPDAGPDAPYGVPIPDADPNYWQKDQVTRQDAAKGAGQRHIPGDVAQRIFDGGNARNLRHPPFTFPAIEYQAGELLAVAFRKGREVARDSRRTPGAPATLQLSADLAGVPLAGDGADAIFLRAEVRDASGTRLPDSGRPVRFEVRGPGEILGEPTAAVEAGIASVLLRGRSPGTIRVRAVAEGLPAAELQVQATGTFAPALAPPRSSAAAQVPFPPPSQNLRLKAPIETWDEAIPLGNGLTGGLLWGGQQELRLSLDRGDLWDERTHGPKEWWKSQTWAKGGPMWEAAYEGTTPTKLPAGALFITLPGGRTIRSFELNLATAEGIARLNDGSEAQVLFSATEAVALLRLPGLPPERVEVLSPVEVSTRLRGDSGGPNGGSVEALGYAKAQTGTSRTALGQACWYRQPAAEGLEYGVYVEARQEQGATLIALCVASTRDGADWFNTASRRCAKALERGYAATLASHAAWWQAFWGQSQVSLPEERFQKSYQFARYLYGAGSRPGAPPMPLQGVWTCATGGLPPWKGDYHSDLNTQMTYIAYQAAGNFDAGLSYLDFLWDKRKVWRAFARDFYETPGLAVPGVMSLSGQPLGGWGAYSLSPTMTSWNAHLFYLHWRHTGEDRFLKERAYPWSREAAECLRALLKPDAKGALVLPRSSSPEWGDNRWWPANTNYDLMCLKMHFLAVAEMAEAQGLSEEARSWKTTAAQLGEFHTAADGELLIAPGVALRGEHHRHLSNLIGIYPFNLLSVEGSGADRRRISTTLARPEWNGDHHDGWCGYSWAWMAALRARTGDGEAAYHHLDVFQQAYTSRNGFHLNGDQTRLNFSNLHYRPFTLEGNFIAMQAVQEMLLQSWSPTPGMPSSGIIRLFPAVPWRWHEASFAELRAEGGFKVSARRENNATTWFKVEATRSGRMRLRDNFGGRAPRWNRADVKRVGDTFEVDLKAGQVLEATLAVPEAIPEKPAGAAEPIVLPPSSFHGESAEALSNSSACPSPKEPQPCEP
jgi:hypothetical protein